MQKKLSKEKLLEIIKSSGDGTLARREAEFILSTLYYDDNGGQIEEITEENLEEIVGGKSGNRALAAALSLGMLGCAATLPARADVGDDIKKFAENNPKIVKGVGAGAGILAGLGALAGVVLGGAKIYTKDIHTDVDRMSSEKVKEYLDEQIKILENRGKTENNFKLQVSDRIKNEANPRILALAVKSLNEIFDRIPGFLGGVKKYAQMFNAKFTLDWEDKEGESDGCARFTLDTDQHKFGIRINRLFGKSMTYTQTFAKLSVKTGQHSPLNMNKLVEAAIAHEMGHCLDYVFSNSDADRTQRYQDIKGDILRENPNVDLTISKYGATNDEEWFAECFAQYMFGDEKINKNWALMKAFKKIISEIVKQKYPWMDQKLIGMRRNRW